MATYDKGIEFLGLNGTVWSDYPDRDVLFEEYGNPTAFAPPNDMITYKRLVAAARNTFFYESI